MEKKSIKNEEMAKRVRNEVALHRKLKHTNILSLYHYFEDDERVYLVMELCAHGEIYSLLKRRRESGNVVSIGTSGSESPSAALSENEARIILRDVVAGLKFLHSHGIIHRDLKLSNILLSESGQAKIADFGLAVRTEPASSDGTGDSKERTICGTPNYLAPEILNKKNYGRGADIWSLGCLLFSFLTGKPPFDSPDLPQTFDKVKRLDYQIPDHLSPAARDLITRLLAGDPLNRPTFDQIIWHPFFNPSVTDPLNTRRLSPLKQVTKYGSIEILSDGRASVDFLDSADVLIISSDGLRLDLLDKRTGNVSQMATPITNLPTPLKRRYEYARRFINLVKAKSPMIILSTPGFKAYLMENSIGSGGNSGDFYNNFRDGVRRMEYCWVSRQLRIFESNGNGNSLNAPTFILSDPSHQMLPEIAVPLHREMLLEFLARYKQCTQIRDSILHPDGTERSKFKGVKFPLIVKEGYEDGTVGSQLGNSMSDGNFNSLTPNTPNRLNTTNISANLFNNSVNMSSISSFNNSNNTTNNNNNNSNNTNVFPSSRKHLPGIGWCLSTKSPVPNASTTPSEDYFFLVLFNDGRAIQIDGHADTVLDMQTNRLLPINSQLPPDIKEMLALFSQFL